MLADRYIENTTDAACLWKEHMETNKQRHFSCLHDISLETQMSYKILSFP